MGKLGGFLQIERHGIPQRDPRERAHDYHEFQLQRPVAELREQGARCMDCGVPFCHNGCPLGQPDPRLERPRLPRSLQGRDRAAARDEQLPRVHRPPLPGAVRGGVRAGDPRGRRGDDQADRERDHQPRLGGGLGHARAAGSAERDRAGRGRGRLRARGHGRGPAAAPRGPRRDPVRARRGGRRAGALRRARLQDREVGRRAAGGAADRRGRRAALRRGRRARRERGSAARRASTRSCSRPARACRAICRSRAASSTACTSRWTTSTSATAGWRASSARADRPRAGARARDHGDGTETSS